MGFSAGYLINKCNVSGLFNQAQIEKLKEDLELLPEEIVDYLDNIYSNFNCNQLYQLIYGLRDGLSKEQVAVYAQNSFAVNDMAMKRFAMTYNISDDDVIKFVDDLGAGLNDSQKGEIKRGIEDGYTIEQIKLYTKSQFKNYYDMRKMREQALRLTNEQAKFINDLNLPFDFNQMMEIVQGYENGFTNEQILAFANPQLGASGNNNQMKEIRIGLEMGLTPSQVKYYANPSMTPKAMENMRNKILSNPQDFVSQEPETKPNETQIPQPSHIPPMPNFAEISPDQPLDLLSANYETTTQDNNFVDLDDFLPQEQAPINSEVVENLEPVTNPQPEISETSSVEETSVITDNLIDDIDPNISLEDQINDMISNETQNEMQEEQENKIIGDNKEAEILPPVEMTISLDDVKDEPKVEISSNIDDMLSQISDADLPTNNIQTKEENILDDIDVSGLVAINDDSQTNQEIDNMIETVNSIQNKNIHQESDIVEEQKPTIEENIKEQNIISADTNDKEKFEDISGKLDAFDTKISELHDGVDVKISNIEDKITKTDSNLDKVKNSIEQINLKMENLDEGILVANSKFTNVDEGISAFNDKINYFDTKISEFSSNLNNLQTNQSENFQNIKKEQEVINSVIQKVKNSDIVIKTIGENLANLSNKFNDLDISFKNLEQSKQDNLPEFDTTKIDSKLDVMSSQISTLTEILQNLVGIQKQQNEFFDVMKKELDEILKQNNKIRPNFRRF